MSYDYYKVLPTYRNWGGWHWSAGEWTAGPLTQEQQNVAGLDPLDELFKRHDLAWDDADQLSDPAAKAQAYLNADMALMQGMSALDPGSLGDYGRAYRNGAMEYFGHMIQGGLLAQAYENGITPVQALFFAAQFIVSPIALDLDGNGVATTDVANGTSYFDHDANGFAERTGWVGQGDGLLALDRNGNGTIDDGSELFGSNTLLVNGTNAENGFAALAEIDGNSDGRIEALDPAYASLKVWVDNGDGHAAPEELLSLVDAGVVSIGTGYSASSYIDPNGNEHRQLGSFTRSDGTVGAAEDVWFKADRAYTFAGDWVDVPSEIAALPNLLGYGNVYNLHQAMAREASGVLKGLVESFIAANDAATRESLFLDVLYTWTGNDAFSPACRGGYMDDGRKLYVLENFLGEGFIQGPGTNYGTPNPGADSAVALEDAFDLLFEKLYAAMMAQTHLKNLYDRITYVWNDASQSLTGNLDAAATTLLTDIALDPVSGEALLREFVRSIVGLDAKDSVNFFDFRNHFAQDERLAWICDSAGRQTVIGTAGGDVLSGGNGDDAVQGDDGNDALDGGYGDDALYGGIGSDVLDGSYGSDILVGGSGSDSLNGGTGDDEYVFVAGDGHDTITDGDAAAGNTDTIRLVGVSPADVARLRTISGNAVTNDVMLQVGAADTVTIQHYFVSGQYKIERVLFDDGTVWTTADLDQSSILPTAAGVVYGSGLPDIFDLRIGVNSTVNGGGYGSSYGYGNDTYIFGLGAGQDTIADVDITAGNTDIIRLVGISPTVVTRLRTIDGTSTTNDLLLQVGAADTLTIKNYFAGSPYKIERVEFEDGTVWMTADLDQASIVPTSAGTVYGSSLADVFDLRNAVSNAVNGGAWGSSGYGNDTYVFGVGAGQDSIADADLTAGNTDTIRLVGVSPTDVVRLRTISGTSTTNDLMLRVGAADTLTIKNYFVSSQYKVERVEFDDGTVWTTAELGQALIVPTSAGTVYGSSLADVFDLRNAVSNAVNGGAWGSSGYGDDTYVFGAGGGQDSIADADLTPGNMDIIRLVGVMATDVACLRPISGNSATNDLMLQLNAADTVTVKNYFVSGQYKVERVQFDDGTVWTTADLDQALITPMVAGTVYGSSLPDVFDLRNVASNAVNGGAYGSVYGFGNDIYIYASGAGQDAVSDRDGTADNMDTIRLVGVSPAEVMRLRTISGNSPTNDLMLQLSAADTLTIKNYFVSGQYKIERVQFDDGTVWTTADLDQAKIVPTAGGAVYGSNLVDTFDLRNAVSNAVSGGAYGSTYGYGNDTYLFGLGAGQDTVSDRDSTVANTDFIHFGAGISNDQLWFSHVGNNLKVSIIGTGDEISIVNWYSGNSYHVENFATADGEMLLDSQVEDLVSAMAAFSPLLIGQTTLPQDYHDALAQVLATSWI